MIRSLTTALATSLLLLALTSCGDEPEPRFADPTSPVTSTSPTPPTSTSVPTSPASTDPYPESAKAFVTRWQQAEFAMQNTGETAGYLTLVDGCMSCDALVRRVSKIYAAGGNIRVRAGTISHLRELGVADGIRTLTYDLRQFPTSYRESGSAPVDTFPGGVETYEVEVVRRGSAWVVTRTAELVS